MFDGLLKLGRRVVNLMNRLIVGRFFVGSHEYGTPVGWEHGVVELPVGWIFEGWKGEQEGLEFACLTVV